MNRVILMMCGLLCPAIHAGAQQIKLTECAPLSQVYAETTDSDELLPMNDVGIERGYLLYQSEVTISAPESLLELENVRDYAVAYLDGVFQGTLTDGHKTLTLRAQPASRILQLYVENIGRITYGPEILDNSRGLFGEVTLAEEAIVGWQITPLNVLDVDLEALCFEAVGACEVPCFRRGYFDLPLSGDRYLDVSGWGMGEVWINGRYLGSFWDEEKQQSILIPSEILTANKNCIVVFDIKNNDPIATMSLTDKPVFK